MSTGDGTRVDLEAKFTHADLGRRGADCGCCSLVDDVGLDRLLAALDEARVRAESAEAERDQGRAEVERLTAKLAQPCGSCHPCSHWAAETWRRAGGKLPNKVEVDEAMERLRLTKAALLRDGQTTEIRWRDAVLVLDCNSWGFWSTYETEGDKRALRAEAERDQARANRDDLAHKLAAERGAHKELRDDVAGLIAAWVCEWPGAGTCGPTCCKTGQLRAVVDRRAATTETGDGHE